MVFSWKKGGSQEKKKKKIAKYQLVLINDVNQQ